MSRDSSGNYTLPVGNPVITSTVIESLWANTTMDDLGAEVTNSLDRGGRGGMLAPLRVLDGSAMIPSLSFTNDFKSGLYLGTESDVRMSVEQIDAMRWLNNSTQVWDENDQLWYDVISSKGAHTLVEEHILLDGQLDVTFGDFPVTAATFYLSSGDADRGRLFENIDYAILDPTTITLRNSQPAGTILFGVNLRNAGDLPPELVSPHSFALYEAAIVYVLNNMVEASDGKFYKSLIPINVGNDPISSPAEWTEIRFTDVYNALVSYSIGEVVQEANGSLWASQTDNNLGNSPSTDDGTNWIPAIQDTVRINVQVGTVYTLSATDSAKMITQDNVAAITTTIPPNGDVAFAIGTVVSFTQLGVGQVTLEAGVGVTLNSENGLLFNAQFSMVAIIKIGINEWVVTGSLNA